MSNKFSFRCNEIAAIVAVGLWSLAPSGAQAAPQVPTSAELYDWAQSALPAEFPGQMATVSNSDFSYRGPYSTGNFMGVQGSTVYVLGPATNNQLLAVGDLSDFSCSVHPASCQATDALEKATAYVNSSNAMHASDVTTGAQAVAKMDACYLNNGYTKNLEIARFDSDPTYRAGYNRQVGSVRSDVQVLAERRSSNPDGSARREIDLRFKVTYADGTFTFSNETLIQGSSSGSIMATGACTTPQDSQDLRLLGNRRIVSTSVTATSTLLDRFKLADGAPLADQPRRYRSEIRFNVIDPANNATYATITGPGIRGTYKLVSPRLLRSAPEFAGKIGNYVDWSDTEAFKACREATGNNYADALVADCTTNGAVSNNWQATAADPAVVDSQFATYGFEAGGSYVVKVYNDDGWKSVNGQSGKTPVASYTEQLNSLPASAAALAAGITSSFPEVSMSLTPVQLAQLARSKSESAVQLNLIRGASVDGEILSWSSVYSFEQGRTAASTANNFYPASRSNFNSIPTMGASSHLSVTPAVTGAMTTPTYAEAGLVFVGRRGYSVRRVITFE